MIPFRNFPDLLQTNSIRLHVLALPKVKLLDNLFRARATTSFCEDCLSCPQFDTRSERVLGLPILVDSYIFDLNPPHTSVRAIQNLTCSESRVDFNSHVLSLFGKPLAKPSQGNDVIPVIVEATWKRPRRDLDRSIVASKNGELILCHLGFKRSSQLPPIREQFFERSGLKHVPREDVGSNLGSFLDDTHRQVDVALGGELLQLNGRRQTRRASTHDDHIVLHDRVTRTASSTQVSLHGTGPRAASVPSPGPQPVTSDHAVRSTLNQHSLLLAMIGGRRQVVSTRTER
mmetsp:Transcript_9090/g.20844  ORF Transcript_9090/g.20844 Transcript_9090/m.20844 type:complete len:288 (+) Transcript_9090:1697-2560(+)